MQHFNINLVITVSKSISKLLKKGEKNIEIPFFFMMKMIKWVRYLGGFLLDVVALPDLVPLLVTHLKKSKNLIFEQF